MGNKGEIGYTFLVKGKNGEFTIKSVRNRGDIKARLILSLLFFFFISLGAESYAQSTANRKKAVENKDSIMPFKSRWALRTNAVDWVMLLPNITAEFDLFGSPYKHYTLGLGVKGNWNTSQNYKPYIVYNLLDIRGEFRQYFRTSQRNYMRPDSVKVNIFKHMKEDVFTIKRLHPRYWRAYYWGIYADYADYTFKFGKTGIQGSAIGFGLSGGFSIPLYGYRSNFVDLELGASIGGVYTRYDKFERDVENNCYRTVSGKSKKGFVPFPVISDLRVAFVYRFSTSVRNKYKMIDYDKINARQEAKVRRKEVLDSISKVRFKENERMLLKRDSVERERLKQRELIIQQKDSLSKALKQDNQLKDSLESARKQEKEQKRLEKANKKAAKKAKKGENENDSKESQEVVTPSEETVAPKEEGTGPKKEDAQSDENTPNTLEQQPAESTKNNKQLVKEVSDESL